MDRYRPPVFLCDTHLGPQSMEEIKKHLHEYPGQREVVLFNSHSDWDHVWGNCAFEESMIIGHSSCRSRLKERGDYDLERFQGYCNGDVEIRLPTLTFDHGITFEEENACG